MPKTSLSLTLVIVVCGGLALSQSGCQKEAAGMATPVVQGGGPKIEYAAVTIDAGDVGPETKNTRQFTFKNVGGAPLKVLSVTGCCGSVTRGVEAGDEYAPGKGGALEVDFMTGSVPGPLVRSYSITTNDPNRPTVQLQIRANVVLFVESSPTVLNLFAKPENAGCGPITLKSIDGRPFSITAFRSTANTITAEFDADAKGTEFILKPKVDVEKLKRNARGQVSIDVTHPQCKNIRVLYDLSPEFSVNPPQLMLFNLRPDQAIQREMWVVSNYGEDFEIESVSSQQGTIKLLESKKVAGAPEGAQVTAAGVAVKTGTRYQLQLQITPPALGAERTILADILEIKIKGGETLSVTCRGFYAGG